MKNEPKFKIYGKRRRELKKKLSLLKRDISGFWYWWNVDDDLYTVYNSENPFPKNKAEEYYNEIVEKIENIELQLAVSFRDNFDNHKYTEEK